MTDLPDLMTSQNLTIALDTDPDKFRVYGSTYMHKDRLSTLPGSRFVGGGKDYWTVPRTWVSLKVLTRLFPDALTWEQGAVDWANSIWTTLIEPSLDLRNAGAKPEWVEAIAKTLPEGILPKDYQVAGAIYLATAKRAMLFDEQGTGKMTQTALTLSLYPDMYPALIICPKAVVWTWQEELAKFGIDSIVIDGGKAEREKQFAKFTGSPDIKVLIISYALVAKHSRVAGFGTNKLSDEHRQHKELNQIAWHTVVADEAHRIKDPDAVQTRACWAASADATNVWALTGTPIESNVLDLWALLHFIDPIEWPAITKYIDLWVEIRKGFFGGIEVLGLWSHSEQEFRDVTEWHWRRALKADDLPPVSYDLRFSEMPAKQAKAYKDMKKQLMAEVDSDGSFDTLFSENHMVKTGRLKQMAAANITIDADDNIRMTEPSWKLDTVEDAMDDYPGMPAIYWFDNRDLLDLLAARLDKKGIAHVAVHGGITGKDRHDNVSKFQRGEVDHILITYGAGSEGITLTRAPIAHRIQRPWSSIKDSQAPFRNLRIGSEIHDRIIYVDYVTKGTVDEDLRVKMAGKDEAAQNILRDDR